MNEDTNEPIRDLKGRFVPGSPKPKSSGRKKWPRECRRALEETLEPERVRKVARVLLEKAEAGDLKACDLVLRYAVGLPPKAEQSYRANANDPGIVASFDTDTLELLAEGRN